MLRMQTVIIVSLFHMMILSPVCAQNLRLIDSYRDDFSTDKVSHDSFAHSLVWLERTFPVEKPHLILKETEGDSGLAFVSYEGDPATLGYYLPVDQEVSVREVSWILEVDLDVRLSMSPDPGRPVMGYLVYKVSQDGLVWSDPFALKHGQNQLSLGLFSQVRYLVFLGSNAALMSVNINLYEPKATILVPDHVPTIQKAINMAKNGDRIVVADGRYLGEGNTNLDFLGKSILLMSEKGPENCIIDGNARHQGILFQSGESRESVVDGFTITNCRSIQGGGILCVNASPTISNCTIKACQAKGTSEPGRGGGLFVEGGQPLVENCIFEDNKADGFSGGHGGAIYIAGSASINVIGTSFSRNQAGQLGQSESDGGAINLASATSDTLPPAQFRESLFYSNLTQGKGAAFSVARPSFVIENCTLANNIAQIAGGGAYIDYVAVLGQSGAIRNSILWSNSPVDLFRSSSVGNTSLVVEYSNLGEVWSGLGNLSVNPLFSDSEHGDYHLLSYTGRYIGANQWLYDTVSSPCIDAGDPQESIASERTPHGRRINMGAYGGTSQASRGNGAMIFHVDLYGGSDSNLGLSRDDAVASINHAVELAASGDYILVWPGQYREEISYAGKAITIQSAADAATVTAPQGYAFSFNQGEGSSSVLRNFILLDCSTGAVFCEVSSPSIQNLTIVNSRVGVNAEENANPQINNCIFWNNLSGDVLGCMANYSLLSSSEGIGNIQGNPLFADYVKDDYHLRSKFGRYWPEHDVWVVDEVTSPCLDRGSPGVHPFEEPMYNGARLNQGAYAGTGYASMSPPHNPADINADGMVDFLDFAEFAESWLLP